MENSSETGQIKGEKGKKLRGENDGRRQILLIFLCVAVYAVSYVSRSSYTANIGVITSKYALTQAQTGLVSSFYFFAYGAGQIINGLLCKKYNKKYSIPFALLLSAAINLLLFFSPPFASYKWLWLINGAGLSVLWSSLVSVLSKNLDDKHLPTGIFCMSISLAIGTFVAYGSSAVLNIFESYRYAYLIAFVCVAAIAVLWVLRYDALTKTSASVGETSEKETATEVGNENVGGSPQRRFSERAQAAKASLASSIWVFGMIGLFGAIGSLIKDGLHTWVPSILKTSFGYPDSLSIALSLIMPLFGLFGSRISLFLSGRFKDFFTPFLILFCTVLSFTVAVKFSVGGSGALVGVITLVLFGLLSLFCYSINNFVTSVVPMKMRDAYDSGTLAGILNGCAYVGSTVSAYALGAIADRFGWNGVFTLFLWLAAGASTLALLCGVVTRLRAAKKGREKRKD